MTISTTYDPAAIERHWYAFWENNNYFAPRGDGEPYTIMIPPPNVTGRLHMGHAFQQTLMDVLIRYQRMQGRKTLWQVGVDHAGIATQMVVERKLKQQGTDRWELGRDKFIERTWQWKAESGGFITQQLRRIGGSVDWKNERFTMDDGYAAAVQKVFIDLYNEKLIYRGKRLVNWDPVLLTAISDLEVVKEEEQGKMYTVRYPIVDEDSFVEIATTRPETILADGAIAVHPSDARFQQLWGKFVQVPLTTRIIPVIADSYVDPEFGTGCVKITPAHDFNDYRVGQRHDMEVINLFHPNATMNDNAPTAYVGLDRFDARDKIVVDLEHAGLLVKVADHIFKRPRGDRSGAVIEPYLTDQWYVAMEPLAEKALNVVRDGSIEFIPKQWQNTFYRWLENIEDWCISRQLWWGHLIPAWYDSADNIYVGNDEAAVRAQHNLSDNVVLQRDADVLDTWFSSALWTFVTLGWPEKTQRLKDFHPTSVLITGFDIIFFWVARMIMMTTHTLGTIPFAKTYIHGLIRDAEGQKMSKTKGNVIDPIDLIDGITLEKLVEKRTAELLLQPKKVATITAQTNKQFPQGINAYGADALRLTYCSLASTGRDIRFDVGRIGGYRNFCNKLWNAARYVLLQCGDAPRAMPATAGHLHNQWIVSRLHHCVVNVDTALQTYRFDIATQHLQSFFWHEYCDWYLELTKPFISQNNEKNEETYAVLSNVLEVLLRLLHPLAPFITEEIWQKIPTANKGATIMLAAYPRADAYPNNAAAEQQMQLLQDTITAVRTVRSQYTISPAVQLDVNICASEGDTAMFTENIATLTTLARLGRVDFNQSIAKHAQMQVVGDAQIHVYLAGVIDVNSELTRLDVELAKVTGEISRIQKKLDNTGFVAQAPAAVVAKEQEKIADYLRKRSQLEGQKMSFAQMGQ